MLGRRKNSEEKSTSSLEHRDSGEEEEEEEGGKNRDENRRPERAASDAFLPLFGNQRPRGWLACERLTNANGSSAVLRPLFTSLVFSSVPGQEIEMRPLGSESHLTSSRPPRRGQGVMYLFASPRDGANWVRGIVIGEEANGTLRLLVEIETDETVTDTTSGKNKSKRNQLASNESPHKTYIEVTVPKRSSRVKPFGVESSPVHPDLRFLSSSLSVNSNDVTDIERTITSSSSSSLVFESKLSLRLMRVAGDGNCLFRAISACVYAENDSHHLMIRNHVVRMMRAERAYFEPFLGTKAKPDSTSNHDDDDDDGDAFEGYLRRLSRPGVWGGEMEVEAASMLYDVRIEIFSLIDEEIFEMRRGRNINDGASSIQLQIKLSYEGGCHYDALLPCARPTKDPTAIESTTMEEETLLKPNTKPTTQSPLPGVLEKAGLERRKASRVLQSVTTSPPISAAESEILRETEHEYLEKILTKEAEERSIEEMMLESALRASTKEYADDQVFEVERPRIAVKAEDEEDMVRLAIEMSLRER